MRSHVWICDTEVRYPSPSAKLFPDISLPSAPLIRKCDYCWGTLYPDLLCSVALQSTEFDMHLWVHWRRDHCTVSCQEMMRRWQFAANSTVFPWVVDRLISTLLHCKGHASCTVSKAKAWHSQCPQLTAVFLLYWSSQKTRQYFKMCVSFNLNMSAIP